VHSVAAAVLSIGATQLHGLVRCAEAAATEHSGDGKITCKIARPLRPGLTWRPGTVRRQITRAGTGNFADIGKADEREDHNDRARPATKRTPTLVR